MSSQLKFLRRVRIHGRECGAVARALHHKVKGSSLYQADSGKALESTIERKSMSTKTTLKRIALVAVSAMGFGVLTSVAPASAAQIVPSSVTIGTVPTAQVGVVNTTTVTFNMPSTTAASDTMIVNVRVTSAPTGSGYKNFQTSSLSSNEEPAASIAGSGGIATTGTTVKAKIDIALTTGNDGILKGNRLSTTDGATVGNNYTFSNATATANAAGNKTVSFDVSVTPDVAGTYTVLVSAGTYTAAAFNAATEGQRVDPYAAGDPNATYSLATSAAVSSVTLAAVTGSATGGATYGQLFKATIKDATGAAAQLAANETVALSSNTSTVTMAKAKANAAATSFSGQTYATTLALSNADFAGGVAYFYAKDSATTGATTVITASGSGLLATSITNTVSMTTRTQSTTAATPAITNPASATRPGSGKVGTAATVAAGSDSSSTTATSHSYLVTYTTAGTVSTYVRMLVLDTAGDITGIVGAYYDQALTLDATDGTTATLSVSGALATAGDSFTATVYGATNSTSDSIVVTSAAAVASSITSDTVNTVTQGHGTSTALSVVLKDQFGAVMANQSITVSTTGRNASTSSTALATDSLGRVSFTRTDAGTSATLNTQDVVTFSGPNSTSRAITINYTASAAATITCLTGNEDDTANLVTYRDISAGDGVQGGAASLCTVTIKDAAGSVLVGVPVTTTTTSEGAAVRSTSATLYTGTAGTVAPSVYGWTSGAKTFTITSGAITKTVTVNYQQRTATEVRTISATLSGNVITVTAKDRLGNLVPGVRVYATRTGDATFGGGSTVANAITAGNTTGTTPVPADLGTAQIVVNPGTGASTVKIQLASAADTPDAEYGQSSSTAGKICASAGCTDTALTAATTGTAFTGEVGVGASLSAAGVNSVTVSVAAGVNAAQVAADAATDAAAEAIDAANAATDAANLAAEAADAATVAAEEARDAADAATAAVEELATQVATLMAALKAQITTLANTVAKIAKKVKA
jgi:hypothetical protein